MVYKVGKLGRFQSRELNLRPGNYTAVGTRNGFRDVHHRFSVVAGKKSLSVIVRCEEKI